MFVQIHTLTGYAGVLLNRDDTGMAKRMPYGDSVRTRTSSQFTKRKIRFAEGEFSLTDIGAVAVRSRATFKRKVAEPLIADGLDAEAVVGVTMAIMDVIYPPSDAAKKARITNLAKVASGEWDRLQLLERSEINVLSALEVSYIQSTVRSYITEHGNQAVAKVQEDFFPAEKDGKKKPAKKQDSEAVKQLKANLLRVGKSASLDVAMFGRMVTGDALSDMNAAVHVAHSITTHAQSVETDFFTAVDDLVTGSDDKGSGHLGEVELTSPMLYGYYVVDCNLLRENLAGLDNAGEVAAKLAGNLVRLVSEYVVGAKKGGTAPYSSADLVMVEMGRQQPRTLAEAYRAKVGPTLQEAVDALSRYITGKDMMYGPYRGTRMVASSVEVGCVMGKRMSVPMLADKVTEALLAEVPDQAAAPVEA